MHWLTLLLRTVTIESTTNMLRHQISPWPLLRLQPVKNCSWTVNLALLYCSKAWSCGSISLNWLGICLVITIPTVNCLLRLCALSFHSHLFPYSNFGILLRSSTCSLPMFCSLTLKTMWRNVPMTTTANCWSMMTGLSWMISCCLQALWSVLPIPSRICFGGEKWIEEVYKNR